MPGSRGLIHLAMSVPPGTLTEEHRTALKDFYGKVFEWREIESLRIPDRLTFAVGGSCYINIRERPESMRCTRYEHFGVLLSSAREVELLWAHERQRHRPGAPQSHLAHVVSQAMYITGGTEPVAVVDFFMGMNPQHLGSEQVVQDVALVGGEHDAFQPRRLLQRQAQALTSAHSVTSRVFTVEEHADQHCQMGNLPLATSWVTSWMRHHLGADLSVPTALDATNVGRKSRAHRDRPRALVRAAGLAPGAQRARDSVPGPARCR